MVEPGTYTIRVRASSYRVRQWYRLDGGPTVEMDLESDGREYVNLTAPKLDIRFVAWFRVVTPDLGAGTHSVTFGVEPHPAWTASGGRQQTRGGIDVVCVAAGGWSPVGTIKLGEDLSTEPSAGDWFPLVVRCDPFSSASITDMGALLDRPAGTHGWLRRARDELRFADGMSVKLWGVGADMAGTPELEVQQARFYAKDGISVVRQHPVGAVLGLLHRDPTSGARAFDPVLLDRFDRWFATLKAHGVYMCWSPFQPHVISPDDGYPADRYAELPDHGAGTSKSSHVAYMPGLQDGAWQWLHALLDHENPYTNLRFADDPALAALEVHNEDSIFWHSPPNDLAGGTAAPRHTAS